MNGKKFLPLYLGDHSPRKKIMCKEDLEEDIDEEDLEHSGDNQFLMIDMMNQR